MASKGVAPAEGSGEKATPSDQAQQKVALARIRFKAHIEGKLLEVAKVLGETNKAAQEGYASIESGVQGTEVWGGMSCHREAHIILRIEGPIGLGFILERGELI